MLLTAMILAAGSVGTVAGTGAKQVQAAENAYYYHWGIFSRQP